VIAAFFTVVGPTQSVHAAILTQDEYIECNETPLLEGDYFLACEIMNSRLGFTYQLFTGYVDLWPDDYFWNSFQDEYWQWGWSIHNGQWRTVGSDGWAVMQGDGNFVLYDNPYGGAAWETNTDGYPGAYLNLQGDMNLVIYSSYNVPLWSLF
jgi:hypothetical protein